MSLILLFVPSMMPFESDETIVSSNACSRVIKVFAIFETDEPNIGKTGKIFNF